MAFSSYELILSLLFLLASAKLIQYKRNRPSRIVPLRGPPNENFLLGLTPKLLSALDRGSYYESWANEYGSIYKVPTAFGGNRIVLCDPKAFAHFHAKDTFTYSQMPFSRNFLVKFFGQNMLSTEKDDHRRQRRAMAPAFSNAALRRATSVFYDSAYKLKTYWDAQFESQSEVVIDVQKWMNRITLDSIGIAGFGHDFHSLDGHQSAVIDAFNSFGATNQGLLSRLQIVIGPIIPSVLNIPTQRARLFSQLATNVNKIALELLERTREESKGEDSGDLKDKSIIGLLIKGESPDTNFKLLHQEVMGHINLFLLAGTLTYLMLEKSLLKSMLNIHTVSLTWCLYELARNPDKQQKLREELSSFNTSDPTWDELTSGIPYLDAVVHETLRIHPPVEEITRMAAEDDVVPLSAPITIATGEIVDTIMIPKGTMVTSPLMYINRSDQFWGPDAKRFIPERWLEEHKGPAKDFHGHRHLYTFSDGPRICLGKGFALAEFKAVLSVLIRNFSYEMLEGTNTEIELHTSILPRPKLKGEMSASFPMRVRRVE
ncbi:hypothetical protein AMATHDRAFT_50010 [Amanita thiersii Skay4041]|uniref:Cytochrome P450 n=1 Tax=Amanita thiersii Skay4041 TaxID=703135 RepID=A0A2A9NJG8_9AGAR|nr:hypothetical protein AMATHDRAFT_50010 [Amanita thiersii Skay4041]